MKRFLLGVGILILLFVSGLFLGSSAQRTLEPIARDLEQAAELALSGDLEGGGLLAKQAKKRWDSNRNKLATLTDHASIDQIDGLLSQSNEYWHAGFRVDFAACCTRTAKLIQASADVYKLTWWNLL